jgi:hypothetical protein
MSFITKNSLEPFRKDKRRPRFSFFYSIVKEHESGKYPSRMASDIRREPAELSPGSHQAMPISSNEKSAKAVVHAAPQEQHRRRRWPRYKSLNTPMSTPTRRKNAET